MANTAPTCNWGDRQPLDFQRYHRALVLCWECSECSECEAENHFCPLRAMEVGPWRANFRERQRRLQRSPSKATPQSTKRRHKAALEGHPRNSWRAITSTGKRGFIRVNAPLPQLLHFITSTPRSEGHQFNNQCLDTFSGGTA